MQVLQEALRARCKRRSLDVNALGPELPLCLVDLTHQLLVCFRHVVERQDTVAQLEEEVRSERNDCPERELLALVTRDLGFERRLFARR
jgi:hypothetical protein